MTQAFKYTKGLLVSGIFQGDTRTAADQLVDDNKDMFAVGNAQGEYSLRQVIRDYLHSARGVHCRPEQILVGAGSEYLLMLLSQALKGKLSRSIPLGEKSTL